MIEFYQYVKMVEITKEFFIEPKQDYPELFHKRIDLEYQQGDWIIILGATPGTKGIGVSYQPVSFQSGNYAIGKLHLEGTAFSKRIG